MLKCPEFVKYNMNLNFEILKILIRIVDTAVFIFNTGIVRFWHFSLNVICKETFSVKKIIFSYYFFVFRIANTKPIRHIKIHKIFNFFTNVLISRNIFLWSKRRQRPSKKRKHCDIELIQHTEQSNKGLCEENVNFRTHWNLHWPKISLSEQIFCSMSATRPIADLLNTLDLISNNTINIIITET